MIAAAALPVCMLPISDSNWAGMPDDNNLGPLHIWESIGWHLSAQASMDFCQSLMKPCHILGREARDHQSKPHLTCLPTGLELSVP